MESLPVDSYSAVPLPGGGQEENHQGIDFQPSGQHIENHDNFAEEGIAVEIPGGAYQFQAGADVVEGRGDGGEVCGEIESVQADDQQETANTST